MFNPSTLSLMYIQMSEDEILFRIKHFIKENRNEMSLGSVDLTEPVYMYLVNPFKNIIFKSEDADNSKAINLLYQYKKILTLFEIASQSEYDSYIYNPDGFLSTNHFCESALLNSYQNSNLILVENMADIKFAVKNLQSLSSHKILLNVSESTDANIDAPEDFVCISLCDMSMRMFDNRLLRRCFYKIYKFANNLFWLLDVLKPKAVYTKFSKQTIHGLILEKIAQSKNIDVKLLSYV